MSHLIVYAHPSPTSFNHAILESARDALEGAGDEVALSDLYAEDFAPVLAPAELDPSEPVPADVRREQARVAAADSLLFVYPIWWFDRPAALKGWCDRVLRPGFAYAPDPVTGAPTGRLGSKRASVIVTLGAAEDQVALDQVTASMTAGTLGFCGVDDVDVLALWAVTTADGSARAAMLEQVRRFVLARRDPRVAAPASA